MRAAAAALTFATPTKQFTATAAFLDVDNDVARFANWTLGHGDLLVVFAAGCQSKGVPLEPRQLTYAFLGLLREAGEVGVVGFFEPGVDLLVGFGHGGRGLGLLDRVVGVLVKEVEEAVTFTEKFARDHRSRLVTQKDFRPGLAPAAAKRQITRLLKQTTFKSTVAI